MKTSWELLLYEKAMLTFFFATTIVLLSTSGPTYLFFEALAVSLSLLFCSLVFSKNEFARSSKWGPRIRLAFGYGFSLWYYISISRICIALHLSLKDDLLLSVDRFLLGGTPGEWALPNPLLADLMSIGYLSFHFYIHGVLLQAIFGKEPLRKNFCNLLYLGYLLGFIGYLVIPGVGPRFAFPELFTVDLPLNRGFSALNDALISLGSSGYDVFPSLHIMMTLLVLDYDFRFHRKRFYWMLPISFILAVSTMYLRYHYLVDVLAAVVFFWAWRKVFWRFFAEPDPA
ncbi:MAG: phosphatidic acid phosphatase [Deltaproteobacteria bacterium]|nr:phosphatidic acid phosphatase [Deltaproteobacteria bacterium]